MTSMGAKESMKFSKAKISFYCLNPNTTPPSPNTIKE